MTKAITTTFTNKFTGQQVVITTKVTDRMEERPGWKRSYGIMKNVQKFEREHQRVGEWQGKQILLWNESTPRI